MLPTTNRAFHVVANFSGSQQRQQNLQIPVKKPLEVSFQVFAVNYALAAFVRGKLEDFAR